LTINGGSGSNTFTISGTPANITTSLKTGSGNDTTNVQATGTGSTLNVEGGGSIDDVNIGSNAPGLGGTLANVHGTVNVSDSGQTNLTVDDDADTTPSTNVVVTSSGITGLGTSGAAIDYVQAGIGVLNIFGGSASNTFTVLGTPQSRVTGEPTTTITPSAGANPSTVNIQAAAPHTNLAIDGQSANDTVVEGSNGSLAGLENTTVEVEAASGGHMALTINDTADTSSETYQLLTSSDIPQFDVSNYAGSGANKATSPNQFTKTSSQQSVSRSARLQPTNENATRNSARGC